MRFYSCAVMVGLGLVAMACEKPMDASEAAASTEAALTPAAQCVRQASDAELIAELQARLATGSSSGAPATTESSVCMFSCSSGTDFTVSVIAPDGSEKKKTVWIGDQASCRGFAEKLSETRQRITSLSLMAVCTTGTDLVRFSVTPAGVLKQLDTSWVGNAADCKAQAQSINR